MGFKDVSNLVPDIYKVLNGADLSEAAERFKDQLSDLLVRRFKEYGQEREPTLRMSNLGKPNRQLWYELKGYQGEPLSPEAKVKFLYGDLIELLIILLIEAAGYRPERMQEEIEIDGVKGHIDFVLNGVLFDVKSCSSYSFNKFESGALLEEGNDPFGYVAQLSGYSKALNLPAAWIAVDKTLGKICILGLPEQDYDISGRIKTVRECVASDIPPERCYSDEEDGKSGNRKLSVGCSYCSYKFKCWNNLRTYAYSNGVKFLTTVKKEPRVFEIAREN